MRFERRDKVEVLIKNKWDEFWFSAQVESYNNKDNTYTVTYSFGRYKEDATVNLPAHAVRPRPPAVATPKVWNVGDYVEVFDDYCWKTAIIFGDMGEGCYYIHVMGSINEFIVKKSDIRARQEWKDDKWVLLPKDSGVSDDIFTQVFKRTRMQKQVDVNVAQHVSEPVMKSTTRKRSRSSAASFSSDDDFSQSTHKKRAVKDRHEFPDSYSFTGKVETFKYNSDDIGDFLEITLESDDEYDCVSLTSSVASCSTVYNALNDRLLSHSSSSSSESEDSLRSDAESLPKDLDSVHSKEEYDVRKHEIELSTYRFTLETFYGWGPLSWEQESLLSNLRSKLCVTDDEYLMELRRLKCIRSNPGLTCC